MYRSAFTLLISLFYLSLINAQTSRRDTKKSVTYRANYCRISGGEGGHVLEIRDGSLWGWGFNAYGQLGDGTNTSKLSAIKIGKDNDWVCVAYGRWHTLAIKSNGTLWAWGANWYGQLGNSDTIEKNKPVQIGINNSWITVVTGRTSSYGILSDGTLWAWGENQFGQLGDSSTKNRKSPVKISQDSNWVSLTASESTVLGLRSNGTLWAWGHNEFGEFGNSTTKSSSYPIQIGKENKWVKISLGGGHALGLKSDGTLWGWGFNQIGQIGDSTYTDRLNPVQIKKDTKWADISAGIAHSFAIKPNGTLWAWGYNHYGQVGDGTKTKRNYPKQIGTDSGWIYIAGRGDFSNGFKWDGKLFGWGLNLDGSVGDGTTTLRTSPVNIGTDNKWVSLAAGTSHSVGLKADGILLTWGDNNYGQLGDSTTVNRPKPVQIENKNGWITAVAGNNHTLGLASNGSLWAWGYNGFGQLGDGSDSNRISPIKVSTNNSWISCSGGGNHSLGINVNGTLWAWGDNQYGQLGNGTNINQKKPSQVGTDNKWVSIAGGSNHTLALKSNGTIWAWGNNASGQLGDGSTSNRTSPVQIGKDSNWISIIAGGNHSLGLKSNGTLWAWGNNSNGQLGDSSINNQSIPKRIGKSNKWIVISAGSNHTFGIKTDGTLWSWGYNSSGQLGDASNTQRIVPTQIGKETVWVSIAAGGSHTIGLKASRQQFCATGLNSSGQLGDSSTKNSNVFTCNNYCIAPEAPLVSSVSICKGNKVTLYAKGRGKLSWYNALSGGTYLGGGSSYSTPVLSTSTKYYVQDSTCSASAKRKEVLVNVVSFPNLSIYTSNSAVCEGFSVILKGKGADSYTWLGEVKDSVSFIPTATKNYTVIGTNGGICSDTATISIIVNKPPKVKASASDTLVCKKTFIKLFAVGAATYLWTNGIKTGVNFRIDSTSIFTVIGLDTNNCSDTMNIRISVKPMPKLKLIVPQKYCCDYGNIYLGSSTFASPIGGVWTCRQNPSYINSNEFLLTQACHPHHSEKHTLIYTFQEPSTLCIDKDSTQFTVYSLPRITASADDTSICKGTSVVLSGSGAKYFTWSEGVLNGTPFIPSSSKSYIVTGTDTNNCSNRDSINVIVNSSPIISTQLNGSIISANQNGASYQWLDCNKNYSPISGETRQNYSATKNGDYAVEITLKDCSDTSACININTIGINKIIDKGNQINIFPNPNKGSFIVESIYNGNYFILNELGQVVNSFELNSTNDHSVKIENLSTGIYFLIIEVEGILVRKKIALLR